ncbi:MAG: sulfate/molybdate ABC transporter ATP-binding protein [Candidatus Acidiferrales bacterium]
MELSVQIEKRFRGGFLLEVAFAAAGAPLGILGPSGSGKSLTLRAIAGLERPDRGRVVLDGRVLFDSAGGVNLPSRERRVGLLFQHLALFPNMTVGENIAFGLRSSSRQAGGPHRISPVERGRHIAAQLAAYRLDGLARRYPSSLSGGQQQRVALARTLAPQPLALLLDEPFSALDTHLRAELERELRETLSGYHGVTLLVSHSMEEAYRFCGDLVVLEQGRVAARGPKEKIFRHPPTMEVARLTGCKNFSRVRPLADGLVEAPDWDCRVRTDQPSMKNPAHVAIRAHHVHVFAAASESPAGENVFPCWLASSTESPFRITLFLRLTAPPSSPADFHLQAEVSKDHWESFKMQPQPWRVQLAPDRLFLLPD